MKEKIQVNMTEKALFDFTLYHTYSKFSGFLTNVLGMAVAFMGIILFVTKKTSIGSFLFFLAATVVFIGYTPVLLRYRARQQMKRMERFKNPAEYTFDSEEGIHVEDADGTRDLKWTEIQRFSVTPKTIGVYYGENHALIIPKEDFGDRFVPVMNLIASKVRANGRVSK